MPSTYDFQVPPRPLSPDEVKDLTNRFNYHKPDAQAMERHQDIRDAVYELAVDLMSTIPDSRERQLALINLEQAMFWANAAIARLDSDGARR